MKRLCACLHCVCLWLDWAASPCWLYTNRLLRGERCVPIATLMTSDLNTNYPPLDFPLYFKLWPKQTQHYFQLPYICSSLICCIVLWPEQRLCPYLSQKKMLSRGNNKQSYHKDTTTDNNNNDKNKQTKNNIKAIYKILNKQSNW